MILGGEIHYQLPDAPPPPDDPPPPEKPPPPNPPPPPAEPQGRAAIGQKDRASAAPARRHAGGVADQNANDEDHENEKQNGKQFVENARRIVAAAVDLRLPICGIAAEHADDAVNATLDPARKIARLEARHDRARNNDRR